MTRTSFFMVFIVIGIMAMPAQQSSYSTLIGTMLGETSSRNTGRINRLYILTEELKKQGILDGELLITQGNNTLFHATSKSVAEHAAKRAPQFMIASLTKQFTAVMLLRALYDSAEGSNEQERSAAIEKLLHEPVLQFLAQSHQSYLGCEGHACPLWPA